MKTLLLFLVLIFPSFATVFSYVQSNNVTNTGSVACAGSVTAGNLLLLIGGGFDSTSATGATDTQTNTYTQVGQPLAGEGGLYMFYAIAKSSGSNTITATSAGTTNMVLICAEYHVPANFLITREVFAGPNLSGFTSYAIAFPFVSVGTPTGPSEVMLITAFYDSSSAHSWTMSSGTKRLDTNPGGGTSFLWGDYDTTSPPASTTIATFVSNNFDTIGATTILSVFPSGGGGGSPVGYVSQ